MIRNHIAWRPFHTRNTVKLPLFVITVLFAASSTLGNLLFFTIQADAATTDTSSGITIGSYNVLTDRWTGTSYSSRASDIAKNIKALGMDVVSMQEFESARGANKIINELGSDWDSLKDNGAAPALGGFGLAFAWNKTKVTLLDTDWVSTADGAACGGGSSKARIGHFRTTDGQEFYLADYHGRIDRSGSCSDARVKNIRSVIKKLDSLAGTSVPAYLAGDTNSLPSDKGGGIYPTVKDLGWGIADDTALQKSGGEAKIDRIFYSTKTVSAPTSFKRSNCTSSPSGNGSCGTDHKPIAATFGAGQDTNTIPITVGTYNVLGYYHGEGSKYAPDRLSQIVKNINSMAYDVVGLQEYRDQASGDSKAFMNELKALNQSWEMSYTKEVGNSGQLNFVYNSSTLKLISDRAFEAASTDFGCGGGTPTARVAKFSVIASGKEFMIINIHPNSTHGPGKCDTARLNVVKGALGDSEIKTYGNPLFFVGDFNARPDDASAGNYDPGPENFLKSSGFLNSRDIPGAVNNGGGKIDHIYYKASSVSAPTSYETMDCTSIPGGDPTKYSSTTTCASDHHPVKAVFGSGSSDCQNLSPEELVKYNEWAGGIRIYDKSCVCTESGTGTTSGTMSGNNNFQKLATYMASKGLTKYAIAGILGNWYSESKMSPFINEAGGGNFPNQGYGLAQWTGGRRTKVLDAIKSSISTNSNDTIKNSFSTYYAAKYAGWPPVTDWTAEKMGEIDSVPTEVNDAWLKAEVDYMFTEFPAYKIGAAHYLSTLKQYVPYVNDSDYILEALNSAKSAGDAATILSVVFEIHQGLDPAQNPRAENAEKMLSAVESAVGASSASNNCANKNTQNADLSSISLDGIDPSTLPEPKGSGHSSWKSSTMDVAKILWYLFPNDFTAFSTRSSGGAVATSCHYKGLAIDMMIADYKNPTVRSRHEAIAEWLMKNRAKLGITNIIYYEKSFNVWSNKSDKPYSEWSPYTNPGGNDDSSAHRNHIHISISPCES